MQIFWTKGSFMKSTIRQVNRQGAYGILVRDSKILLTQKKSGPYKGLWGLPGGSIEFSETPESALKRELVEESALKAEQLEFSKIVTATGQYEENGEPYGFHQIGLIYKVLEWTPIPNLLFEEENCWMLLNDIPLEKLTPFAKQIVSDFPKDNAWRPNSSIRDKVIGIAVHENRLLVCEVLDDEKNLKGWCPLGGGIEFGETAEKALKREILEELGCDIQVTGKPCIYENIFEHHGVMGHEIIFAFPITFDNPEIYKKERFQILEDKGTVHWVEWIEIDQFRKNKTVLFPQGIMAQI
jgi:ADP-ribose pyrophosphatase YjhB (NUDIX family)